MAAVPLAETPETRGSIPATLRFATIGVLLFILVLMTADLVIWAHGGMTLMVLAVVLGSEMLVVGVWLALEMRSQRYVQPSIERPTRWFLHHLRRWPLLFVGFFLFTYALRYAGFMVLDYDYFSRSFLRFLLVVGAVEACKVGLLYFCWLGLVFGFQSLREVRERNERLLSAQRSLAEAQLTQLRAQLRPHFLFNALNTISATMQSDVARADRLLTQLGDLLRASLDTDERQFVTVEEEVDLLRRYADIMLARFGDRTTIEWHVDPTATTASIPSMLLQPLLENAFKHGVERSPVPQNIHVHVTKTATGLQLAIHNTGSTLAQPYREGFGTRSCRERLTLIYSGAASFSLREHEHGGVEASIDLPWQGTTSRCAP